MLKTTKHKLSIKLQFTIICINLLLSGCNNIKYLPQYDPEEDNLSEKGIVVIKTEDSTLNLTFKKLDKDYNKEGNNLATTYTLTDKNQYFFSNSDTYDVAFYALEPGVYYISSANYTTINYAKNQKTYYYTTKNGITPDGYIVYGAFEVKRGEILFIGDIKPNFIFPRDLFRITGDLEKTKSDLLSSNSPYKNLATQMKQSYFHTVGSKIYKDIDGIFKIKLDRVDTFRFSDMRIPSDMMIPLEKT